MIAAFVFLTCGLPIETCCAGGRYSYFGFWRFLSFVFGFSFFRHLFLSSLCMGVTNLVLEVTNRKKSRGSALASPPLHSGGARRASRRSVRSERSEHCVVLLTCALLVRGLVASAGVSGLGPTWSWHGGVTRWRRGDEARGAPGRGTEICFGQIPVFV